MQTIPILALATPDAAFMPEKVSYYRNTVVPRLYYLSPPLLATLGLLLGFVAWRVVRRCCRCCCQWCCVTPTEVRSIDARLRLLVLKHRGHVGTVQYASTWTELRPPDSGSGADLNSMHRVHSFRLGLRVHNFMILTSQRIRRGARWIRYST